MKALLKIVGFVVWASLLAQCSSFEPTERVYPVLETGAVRSISDSGAVFSAKFRNRGNDEILQYGFVWSEVENPTLETSEKVVFKNSQRGDPFSTTITTTLKTGVLYYVKPFVIASDYMVYGEAVTFMSKGSKAALLRSFYPKIGTWGDTIRIQGEGFSYIKNNNVVKMGTVTADVLSASDTLLVVKVPILKNELSVKMNVSIVGNVAASLENFDYLVSKINSIEPLLGSHYDTVFIYGEHFGRTDQYNAVYFGVCRAMIVSNSVSCLKVLVPGDLIATESDVKVISVGQELVFGSKFKLN